MPTSIHVPKPLLDAVDRKARSLAVSRNQLILRALQREVTSDVEWTPGFFDALRSRDPRDARALGESMKTVLRRRTRKKPPAL